MIKSVVIDSREPDWVKALNFFGAETTVTAMDAGDLLVICEDGAGLLIERKTPNDFIGSLVSERMLIQSALKLAPYRDQGFWPYVMITGDFYVSKHGKASINAGGWMKETRVDFTSIWGELLSIQELGVFITFAKSSSDYEDAVLRLSNRTRGELKAIPPARRRGAALGEEAVILESLPGIGDKRVKQISEQYKPIEFFAALSRGERPAGIGEKTGQKILRALGIEKQEIVIKEKSNE